MELQWQENTTSVKPPHWQSGYPGYREGEETVVMRGHCGLWWTWEELMCLGQTWEEPMCLGQTCHRSSVVTMMVINLSGQDPQYSKYRLVLPTTMQGNYLR